MNANQQQAQFEIETYAKAIAYLANNEDADLGNREILLTLLAEQIIEKVHQTLSE